MIEPSDWRLQGQGSFLKDAVLLRRAYHKCAKNPAWDHDHCEFCQAKFSVEPNIEALHEGYVTSADYHWICPTCYDDFKELFNWSAKHSPKESHDQRQELGAKAATAYNGLRQPCLGGICMIRAIYHNGAIRPLDEIPSHWLEGEELTIEQTGGKLSPEEVAELDNWVAEVNAAAALISDEDHAIVEAAIAEHRAEAKRMARREMGLPE